MRNVSVVAGYLPTGGCFMAYHVGLIAAALMDARCVCVTIEEETAAATCFDTAPSASAGPRFSPRLVAKLTIR